MNDNLRYKIEKIISLKGKVNIFQEGLRSLLEVKYLQEKVKTNPNWIKVIQEAEDEFVTSNRRELQVLYRERIKA